jgi:hypothetical protein
MLQKTHRRRASEGINGGRDNLSEIGDFGNVGISSSVFSKIRAPQVNLNQLRDELNLVKGKFEAVSGQKLEL